MPDDFERVKDLYKWNKNAFDILGIWPLKQSNLKCHFWILYLTVHFTMEMADLYCVFGNLEQMVLNLSESSMSVMVILKIIVIRYSSVLKKLMNQLIDDIDERHFSDEEKIIYLKYNQIATSFFKMWGIMTIISSIAYHFQPLEFRLRAALGSENMPFFTAYREHLFFEMNDSLTFWLFWTYQSPLVYVYPTYAFSISYVLTLVFHVCGRLSILSNRIKSLDTRLRESPEKSKIIFRDIIETHCSIHGFAKDIESVFNLLLLEELFMTSLIIGLSAYTVIVKADATISGDFFAFFMYSATLLALLNGYCIAGEYLATESENVYDAYYQCQWYEMTNSSKKQLMLCMMGATTPMQLTGGGYYVFSLASFTNILKTIMGYISMLRTII